MIPTKNRISSHHLITCRRILWCRRQKLPTNAFAHSRATPSWRWSPQPSSASSASPQACRRTQTRPGIPWAREQQVRVCVFMCVFSKFMFQRAHHVCCLFFFSCSSVDFFPIHARRPERSRSIIQYNTSVVQNEIRWISVSYSTNAVRSRRPAPMIMMQLSAHPSCGRCADHNKHPMVSTLFLVSCNASLGGVTASSSGFPPVNVVGMRGCIIHVLYDEKSPAKHTRVHVE